MPRGRSPDRSRSVPAAGQPGPAGLPYERADTAIGTVPFAVGAVAVLIACAAAFSGTPLHGAYLDAGTVADELGRRTVGLVVLRRYLLLAAVAVVVKVMTLILGS
jgi:hypothetical protein